MPIRIRLIRWPRENDLLIQHDALGVGINIERGRPQKAEQGLATFTRKVHGEGGGRGDRRDDGDSRGQRFLHDFE